MTTDSTSKQNKSKSKTSFNLYYLVVFIIVLITILVQGFSSTVDAEYIVKSKLDSDLQKLITNKAKLGEFQTVYQLHKESADGADFFSIFSDPSPNEYYEKSLPLSEVLMRYKASVFVAADALKKKEIDYLNSIINQELRQNPFDKLENSQKQNFLTIMAKLDKNYKDVENEFNWLIDELKNKNSEVRKHRNKAEINFWIAISGLILSLSMGAVLIYLLKK